MPNERRVLKNVVNNDKMTMNEMKMATKDVKKENFKKETKNAKVEVTKSLRVPKMEAEMVKEIEAFTLKASSLDINVNIDLYHMDLFDIDKGDEGNPQLMSEYAGQIYQYLRVLEAKYHIKDNFMSAQTEIDFRMRSILINWLVQVHSRFHLLLETLFMAISILDRYIERAQVAKSKFQLVGVTSLWIASKCEEIYVPDSDEFLYVTDSAYTKQEILEMEITILRVLDFDINAPLQIHFLRRYSKAGRAEVEIHNLSKFLIELSLSDYSLASALPSLVAAASLCLSRRIFDIDEWTDNLIHHSTYTEDQLHPVICKLAVLLTNLPTTKLKATRDKYSSPKFLNISRSDKLKSEKVFKLAGKL